MFTEELIFGKKYIDFTESSYMNNLHSVNNISDYCKFYSSFLLMHLNLNF